MAISLQAMRERLHASVNGADPGRSSADELCTACTDLLGLDGAAVSVVSRGASRGTFGASGESSRRLDQHQFTFGEGPCLDAVATRTAVLVPDLRSPDQHRWPAYTGAVLADGIRGVFALPIQLTDECVGALDLFRSTPGPLRDDDLAGALLAAELAAAPLLDLIGDADRGEADEAHERTGEGSDPLIHLDRVEVYQATGMLISQLDVDADEALLRLRAHAITAGLTASDVAWAIINRQLLLERDDSPFPDDEIGPAGNARRSRP